jgi:hypothetical protein
MKTSKTIRIVFAVLALASFALGVSANAVEIEGVKIDDTAVLSSGGPELVLNGAGVRHKLAFIEVYIGSLYLQKKNSDSAAIFADPGPKRVSMHFLINEVTADYLIASMNNALAANLAPYEIALIEKRVRDLNIMMSSLKVINKGSVVLLDYIPEVGTRVTVNGEEKLTIPGEDFFRAMLNIWIGNKPVDGRLRNRMLGINPGRLF